MKRNGGLAFLLVLAFVFCFTFDRCASGQEPAPPPTVVPAVVPTPSPTVAPKIVTPLGPPQIITPPLVTPTPAPPLQPTPEDESPKIEIIASIGGESITEHPVKLPIGRKLTLLAKGVKGFEPGPVSWSMNETSADADADPTDSHRMTFSSPVDSVWLFTASVNNPDATLAPLVVQKWVVVGRGPQPPPDVVPPKPAPTPTPTPNPVTTGSKRVIVIRESLEPSPEMGRLIVLMQSGPIGEYMKSKKHEFESFDKDAKDENDQPSAYVKKWLEAIGSTEIPAAAIVDIATGTIDDVKPLGKSPTAKALLDLVKEHGG